MINEEVNDKILMTMGVIPSDSNSMMCSSKGLALAEKKFTGSKPPPSKDNIANNNKSPRMTKSTRTKRRLVLASCRNNEKIQSRVKYFDRATVMYYLLTTMAKVVMVPPFSIDTIGDRKYY
mmetsp:Transcript_8801/g.13554  ORF Transcript_8801/g.13554 Transcript_8801/m.13554 type:complete len:121 (-) Transcript_8801:347-709(-)